MSEQTRVNHPSFGFIRASRVSGHAALFDSALRHQHYITITVGASEQIRENSRTWNMAGKEYIQVSMSEAQYATFLTSLNMGSGAPCTLTRLMGAKIEEPPADTNTRTAFDKEIEHDVQEAIGALKVAAAELSGLVGKGKATRKELNGLQGSVEKAIREISLNAPFILTQFAEYMETLTERAKADLNAHATLTGQRLGAVIPVAIQQAG